MAGKLSAINQKVQGGIEDLKTLYYYLTTEKDAKQLLKTNPQPPLTEAEKEEIDAYWRQFGIRFKSYSWFQWYYGFTGIRSPRFIPTGLHGRVLVIYHNMRNGGDFARIYNDKNLFYDFTPELNLPVPVLKCIDGNLYDGTDKFVAGGGIAAALLTREPEVLVKQALDSRQGMSVKKYTISSRADAEKVLDDWKDCRNYIVQRPIRQHPFFARFNATSVNVIRINSYYHDGRVDIHTPVLRFGYPGQVTDVSHIGGIEDVRIVGITPDGYLMDEVKSILGKKWKLEEVIGPLQDKKIPAWDEIIDTIKKTAPKIKHITMIGWDVTVSEDGRPVFVEYNTGCPSPLSSQLTGGPMYGDLTEDVLAFLKDKHDQKTYIPHWLRCR